MAIQTSVHIGTGSPETQTTAAPGSLWLQSDSATTTVWRKMAGTGTDATGWLRSELNVLNIRDFGALCDGSANDYAAWDAAISAADAIDGVVFHPGGVSRINSPLTPPSNTTIQFIGGPGAIIQAGAGFPANSAMLTITGSGAGSRYGAMRDLRFDGNGIAAMGLDIFAVQRQFENIVIENCTQTGLLVNDAQNCTFLSCTVERNGTSGSLDANCVIDHGAANNLFLRCQFSPTEGAATQGKYNLIIRQSNAGSSAVPQVNTFVGCQFERAATSYAGATLQRAGRNNTFVSCTFNVAHSPLDAVVRRAVTVNRDDGKDSSSLRLVNCKLSGQVANSIGISAATSDGLAAIVENVFLENFLYGFEVADDSYVEVVMPWQVGGAANLVTGISPATKTAPRLVVQRAMRLDGVPSNSTGTPFQSVNTASWLYDGINHLLHFFSTLNPQWRSIDVVQQAIAATEVTSSGQMVAIDMAGVRYHQIYVNSGTALPFTILAPTHAVVGRRLTIDLYNINGMGTIMWTGGAGGFRLEGGAFTNPSVSKHILISFEYDGGAWREVSRTADQPN